MAGILMKLRQLISNSRQGGIDYITDNNFWITGVYFVSFAQLLASISFLLYKNVFNVSPTYGWLSGVTDQHTWGLFGITVALLNFLCVRRRIMTILFPLTITYWALLSYGSLISVGGVTPGGTLTLSIAILASVAYIAAGGFKMLHYRRIIKHGHYTKEGYQKDRQ